MMAWLSDIADLSQTDFLICISFVFLAGLVRGFSGFALSAIVMAGGLVIGSFVGVPIGLLATTTFPIEFSKLAALCLIMLLATAQLFRFAPKFLDTKLGLYGAGLTAGVATGLASVGGMVVALYVLASKADPKTMRASLIVFLMVSMVSSLIFLLAYDVMNMLALKRGLVFAPVVALGVVLGSLLFRPSLQVFYRQFCLTLLLALAGVGLVNLLW